MLVCPSDKVGVFSTLSHTETKSVFIDFVPPKDKGHYSFLSLCFKPTSLPSIQKPPCSFKCLRTVFSAADHPRDSSVFPL